MSITASLKWRDKTKWKQHSITELKGKSIITYMAFTDKECIAALLKDGSPFLFVSNRKENVEQYSKKGVSLSVDDLMLLFGAEMIPDIAVKVFPDATFVEMKSDMKDDKQWW